VAGFEPATPSSRTRRGTPSGIPAVAGVLACFQSHWPDFKKTVAGFQSEGFDAASRGVRHASLANAGGKSFSAQRSDVERVRRMTPYSSLETPIAFDDVELDLRFRLIVSYIRSTSGPFFGG
jgi:hypothetical protein